METREITPSPGARFNSSREYRVYQARIAREALLPWLRRLGIELCGRRLLDVGCGTGGMTDVWREEGATAVGLDIDTDRLRDLKGLSIIGDVTRLPTRFESFDLVFAHDCLEHVAGFEAALDEIRRTLKPGGRAFVTFPPYYSAYGGHQQGSRTWAAYLPYGHLLPPWIWLRIVRSDKYSRMYSGLARLSMGRFERAVRRVGLRPEARLAYAVRPEVAMRCGVPAFGASIFASIPAIRELVVGGVFYLLRK